MKKTTTVSAQVKGLKMDKHMDKHVVDVTMDNQEEIIELLKIGYTLIILAGSIINDATKYEYSPKSTTLRYVDFEGVEKKTAKKGGYEVTITRGQVFAYKEEDLYVICDGASVTITANELPSLLKDTDAIKRLIIDGDSKIILDY